MTLFQQLQILQVRHQIRSTLVIAHKGTAGIEYHIEILNDISNQIEDLIEIIEEGDLVQQAIRESQTTDEQDPYKHDYIIHKANTPNP